MANWFAAFKIESSKWFTEIIKFIPENIKKFHADDLHMTIAFLGDLDPSRVDQVKSVIENCSLPSFSLYANKFILLPREKHFTAFCLEFVKPQSDLTLEIEKFRTDIYIAAGIKPDIRKFLPHVTMGRPQRTISSAERINISQWVSNIKEFNVTVHINRLALYTWSDNRQEKLFKTICEKDF